MTNALYDDSYSSHQNIKFRDNKMFKLKASIL
jgi:hypothetical protein